MDAQTVTLADGRQLRDTALHAGPSSEEIRLVPINGEPLVVRREELLLVDFHRFTGFARPWVVELVNGDRLLGEVEFPAPQQVSVGGAWGTAVIPFEWLSGVRLATNVELPTPRADDIVLVDTTGPVAGRVRAIEGGRLQLDRDGNVIPIDLERVRGFVLRDRLRPDEPREGLQVTLDLGAGERLNAHWLAVDENGIRVRTAWGQELELPLRSLSRMEVRDGKLLYLSEMEPVEEEQTSFFGGFYPHRTDLSHGGRPLRLGGKTYARGLGVRAYSSLTYALEGEFARFTAVIGVDDEVGASGSVIFRVFADGRLLYESPILRGGDAPQELDLDVGRALMLRLEVDYADFADVGDHANWADARLLRTQPPGGE